MDYTLSTKQMSSSRANIVQSDHVHVMTNTSSLMKKRMPVRSSGVLKLVENATAMKTQNYALNGVRMDSNFITNSMLRFMARIEQ